MKNIKIATWNIGSMFDNSLNGKKIIFFDKYKKFKELLAEQNPDILCLQEMYDMSWLKIKICDMCGFSDIKTIPCSDSVLKNGAVMEIAVFSKKPLSKSIDVIEIPKPFEKRMVNGKMERVHQKFFFGTEFALPNSRVLLITGHGYPSKRYKMIDKEYAPAYIVLDDFIKKYACNYVNSVVVCADFNIDDPLKYMPYTSSLMIDAFANEATRPSGRKTDGIMVPIAVNIENKINISIGFDHNYISADILF